MQARALGFILLVALAGCGGGGSGGGAVAGGATGGAASTQGGQGAQSHAHWQTALAALGAQPQPPIQPTFEQPALDSWNHFLGRCWPEIRSRAEPVLDRELRAALGGLGGSVVRVSRVKALAIDAQAPVSFGGATSGTSLELDLLMPAAPASWSISATIEVEATFRLTLAGIPVNVVLSIDVTADVRDIRVTQPVFLDASNPARPFFSGAGAPRADLSLALSSTDPLLGQIAGPLSQLLDPVIRAALIVGSGYVQREIGLALQGVSQPPWGLGGAPAAGVPGAPDLNALAVHISDEIRRHHIPFGTIVSAEFDQPGYGNGTVVRHNGHGDSTIWTGHYLMAEALRAELTGDARALDGARRVAEGLDNCIGLAGTPGLLSRCVVPVNDARIVDIRGGLDYHEGVKNGVRYGGHGDISRDQYLGVFMGLTQAYLRVPELRPRARRLISEMVDFLDANDWTVFRVNEPWELARFGVAGAQTPGVVLAFTKSAYVVDPARHGALHDRAKDLSSVIWLATFGSSREPLEAYYKFNLQHAEFVLLFGSETDPARYRHYTTALEIIRDVVGHHDNAWFDVVNGMAVPASAPEMGRRVRNALERFTLRDRRAFSISNSQDPSIGKVLYTSPLLLQTPPHWVATQPIPIEKRVAGDYLWQTQAFQLDGHGSPYEQHPGVDFVLPYWVARSYGFLP